MKTYTLTLFGFDILRWTIVEWEPVDEEPVMPDDEPEYYTRQVDDGHLVFTPEQAED